MELVQYYLNIQCVSYLVLFTFPMLKIIKKLNNINYPFLSYRQFFNSSKQLWDQDSSLPRLSELVIKTITHKPHQQILNFSLRDKIIKDIVNHPFAHPQAKQKILKIFTTGYSIDTNIFRPSNIQSQLSEDNKLVFCPTHLVTGQIFEFIQSYNMEKVVLSGQYGISKSFSFMLYQILSNYIIEYKMKRPSSCTIASSLINVQKVIGWAIDTKTYNEFFTNQYIFKQCSQIQEHIKDIRIEEHMDLETMQMTFEKKIKIVQKIYAQKNIQLLIVVDQINEYASLVRRIIEKQTKIKQLQNKLSKLSLSDIEQSNQQRAEYYNEKKKKRIQSELMDKIAIKLRDMIKISYSLIYLTSVDIQQHLLKTLDLNNRSNQVDILVRYVWYSQKLVQRGFLMELIDIFVFYVGQNIKTNLFDEVNFEANENLDQEIQRLNTIIKNNIQLKKKIRTVLLNEVKIPQKQIFTNFYLIDQYYKKHPQIKNLKDKMYKINQWDEYIKIFINDINKLMDWSIKHLKKKLDRFLFKVQSKQDLRLKIIHRLKIKSESNVKVGKKYQLPQVTLKQLKLTQTEVENNITNELFQYDNRNEILKWKVPSGIILKVLQQDKLLKQYQQDNIKTQLNQLTHTQIGCRYQRTILNIFQSGIVKGLIISWMKKPYFQFPYIRPQFYIFSPLPLISKKYKNYRNYYFLEYLSYFFKILIKRPIQSIVLLPIKSQMKSQIEKRPSIIDEIILNGFNKQQRLQNSKAIDFIIMKLYSLQKKFRIYAFDTTISEKNIGKKLRSFLNSYELFKDKRKTSWKIQGDQYELELRYYVLGPIKTTINWETEVYSKWKNNKKEIVRYSINSYFQDQNMSRVLLNRKDLLLKQFGVISSDNLQLVTNLQTQGQYITELKSILQYVKKQKKIQPIQQQVYEDNLQEDQDEGQEQQQEQI